MPRKLSLWDRLLGRKPAPDPTTPEEQMRVALEALRVRQERRVKKGCRERKHVDDRRELVIRKDHSAELPEDLASLTAQGYANRRGTETEEEEKRVSLRPVSGNAPDAEAAEATREIERGTSRAHLQAAQEGHYYSPRERLETGEVDRTYEIERPKSRKDGAPKKS